MLVELLNGTLEERGESDTNHDKMFQTVNKFMKPITRATAVLLLVLLVTGCTSTIKRTSHLQVGMTRAEVINALGSPLSTMSAGGTEETLRYQLTQQRLYRLAVPLKFNYAVHLEDGRVVNYGPDETPITAGSGRYSVWWKEGATPEEAHQAVAQARLESERAGMVNMSAGAFWFREAQKGNLFKSAMAAQGYQRRVITIKDHPRAADYPRT